MKLHSFVLPAVALMLATALSSTVGAADNHRREPLRPRRAAAALAEKLDLTAEQRHALQDILRQHRPMLEPAFAELRAQRQALREIVARSPLDESALDAQSDRIAAAHKQVVLATARWRADLRKVLTPEQLATLESRRARGGRRGGERSLFERMEKMVESDPAAVP